MTEDDLRALLDDVQGNVIDAFGKDHQRLLLFEMTDPKKAKAWLSKMSHAVASGSEVRDFNDLFRRVRDRRGGHREILEAVWTQLLITSAGLKFIGVADAEVAQLGPEFVGGMKSQAEALGDTAESDPSGWREPYRSRKIHVMLVVAADERQDLDEEIDFLAELAQQHDLVLVGQERGNTLTGALRGHEHFGFKDGISQPRITELESPASTPAGPEPGPVPLGEFVLGYDAPHALPNIPGWAKNGSLVAFRRLSQDVAAFRQFVSDESHALGLDSSQFGAKLVGRWKSGAPLDLSPDHDDPVLAQDSSRNNDFDYSSDPSGFHTPRFAHIRKVNPRNEQPIPGIDDAQARRILRRGIPYGRQLGAAGEKTPQDRGLLFFCAQGNIGEQFQFIQKAWANDPNFPQSAEPPVGGYQPTPGSPADGPDPIVGQHHGAGADNLKRENTADAPVSLMRQFVTVTGGEYFFCPSIATIEWWAS
jgi:Dyp-type peroxidase family